MTEASVFSKIIAGEIPAEFVYEDEQCVVISDIHPQAPVHLLVIPRKPIVSLLETEESDAALLGHLMFVASKVAKEAGLGKGFRLVVNNGRAAGQTVFHLHLHVLGGRKYAEAGL